MDKRIGEKKRVDGTERGRGQGVRGIVRDLYGGAERVVTTIASSLADKGYTVTIISFCKEIEEYKYSGKIDVKYIIEKNIDEFNKLSKPTIIFKIRKIVMEEKPDEIITFLTNVSVLTYLACMFTKYKRKISFAIRSNPKMESGIYAKLHYKFAKKIKNIITQNNGQTTCYDKKLQKKIITIPNPMYEELFEFEKTYVTNPVKIVSVGRLIEKKNFIVSIYAFEKLLLKYPNLEFYIYGVGPLENQIIKLIKEKKLEKRVFLKGFEVDRNKIYGDKDIFLLASRYEGMPNVLAEAMCMGIPSISTNCDYGPRDLILNDDMGLLVDGFEIDDLEKAIDYFIMNYNKYIQNAKNAKKILREKYSLENIVNQWILFLEK